MEIKKITLKDLSKEELLDLREDLIVDLNQYEVFESQGVGIDPEIVFQTESALLAIDELLEATC